MAARVQRFIIYAGALLASVSLLGFGYFGLWKYGLTAVTFLLSFPALVLTIEYVILWHVEDAIGRPEIKSLLAAWLREVVAYTASFGWEQPFLSKLIPDSVPTEPDGRRAVLLIHGLACNRGFWNPWMRRLRAHGYAYLAIDLEPMFGSIEDYEKLIDAAVVRLHSATALPPVIVAHSMGGLAVRQWRCNAGARAAVHRIISIGTPHHGTWMARFAKSLNARQMRIGSEWLLALAVKSGNRDHQDYTCYYGNCDNVVFPKEKATLAGADNRRLDGTGHVALAGRREIYDETLRWLA